jgi:hypothetical protein
MLIQGVEPTYKGNMVGRAIPLSTCLVTTMRAFERKVDEANST